MNIYIYIYILRSFHVGTKTSKKSQYWAHADHVEFLKPYQGPGRCVDNEKKKKRKQIHIFCLLIYQKEDEDNECDLGYQVLAKPTSNSGDDDLNTSITQTQTATNNTNNADGISGNISGLPLNTSPTVVSCSSAIGLVNATSNTTTTAARLVLLYLQYNYHLL
ncbi:uncharacterized protein LOC119641016 [Glossina fuscipes]|uniref:Uncharacterized protein LOC119641016 n=1 Tax=Glossina fuscipes TaxID=7396 RepID=A0A9C5ZFV1_9MUSC|nr:uncharacterized protein LOC119641016 [Glossina fuscipes]